jgi:hypothetical protein
MFALAAPGVPDRDSSPGTWAEVVTGISTGGALVSTTRSAAGTELGVGAAW